MRISYKELSQEVKSNLKQSIENHNNGTTMIHMVSTMFGINISDNTIKVARRKYADQILEEYGLDPGDNYKMSV